MVEFRSKVDIFKPHARFGHKGDSFREIIDMWEELGFVTVHESPDRYVWLNEPGNVLLHDLPLVYDVVNTLPKHRIALFGNEIPDGGMPWIFWGRRPRLLDKIHNEPEISLQERTQESIFVGKVENQTQIKNRFQSNIDWTQLISEFHITVGLYEDYKYTQEQYLRAMRKSKFALLLPGYGPKCNRDIEAIAMGCIPLVTKGVDTTYADSWSESMNYLYVDSADDYNRAVNMSDDELNDIRLRNYKWYADNASPAGSFTTTMDIVRNYAG